MSSQRYTPEFKDEAVRHILDGGVMCASPPKPCKEF